MTPDRRPASSLAPGTRVRVGEVEPDEYKRPPEYAAGSTGTVVAVRGSFVPPDRADPEPLVAVRFRAEDLWDAADGANRSVQVDIWEDCLTVEGAP